MKYYFDTNICVYFLKGVYKSLLNKIMSFNPDEIKIPSIVMAELLYGVEKSQKRDENLKKVLGFLLPYEIVVFDDAAAVRYSKIRVELEGKGTVIGPNDLIISATVLSREGILVTNNEKEFSRISGLNIENWINDKNF
jgi:tRNA(fMet)-specific endonuclease VapC